MSRQRPLTSAEASRLLQITERLVRRYVAEGRLKARRRSDGSHAIWLRDLQAFQAVPRRRGRPLAG